MKRFRPPFVLYLSIDFIVGTVVGGGGGHLVCIIIVAIGFLNMLFFHLLSKRVFPTYHFHTLYVELTVLKYAWSCMEASNGRCVQWVSISLWFNPTMRKAGICLHRFLTLSSWRDRITCLVRSSYVVTEYLLEHVV